MKKWIQFFVGCGISVVFLYYSLRKAEWSSLASNFASINWWWAIPMVALTLATMEVRSWRWHYLLKPARDVSARKLFSPLMIGFAFNGIFPARAGEFARSWLVSKKYDVPLTSVFATVIVERLYDLATLCGVIALTFYFMEFEEVAAQTYDARWSILPGTLRLVLAGVVAGLILLPVASLWWTKKRSRFQRPAIIVNFLLGLACIGYLFTLPVLAAPQPLEFGQVYTLDGSTLEGLSNKLIFTFIILFAMVVLFMLPVCRRLAERICGMFPGELGEKLVELVRTVGKGLDSLTSWKLSLMIALNTLMLWGMVAWTLQIMAWGFIGMEDMTLFQGLAITMLICLAIMIPAAPGYWGLYEVGCVLSIMLLGITDDYDLALTYSLTIHALQVFPIIAWGLALAARENLKISEIQGAAEQVSHPDEAEAAPSSA